MYQPLLFIHWRQARLLLAPAVVAAFGLPLLAVQGLGPTPARDVSPEAAYSVASAYVLWLPLFPLLAAAIGAGLALASWNWDHKLNHVYALSLPLARWEYVMLKMGAGLVLALLPGAALWIGAHVAAASLTLPVGLQAYPNELGLRFLLAIALAYALVFALAAGTIRTTTQILTGLVGGLVIMMVLQFAVPGLADVNVLGTLTSWLVRAGGPLRVFTGNWALIDV